MTETTDQTKPLWQPNRYGSYVRTGRGALLIVNQLAWKKMVTWSGIVALIVVWLVTLYWTLVVYEYLPTPW